MRILVVLSVMAIPVFAGETVRIAEKLTASVEKGCGCGSNYFAVKGETVGYSYNNNSRFGDDRFLSSEPTMVTGLFFLTDSIQLVIDDQSVRPRIVLKDGKPIKVFLTRKEKLRLETCLKRRKRI